MIVYDGKYSWKGNTTVKKRPISWWRSSYHLRVVDLSQGAPGVVFLKPHVVLFTDSGDGASVANCMPDLAKQICEDFNLDLNRVVWVEDHPEAQERFRIAVLKQVARLGGEAFYRVSWRSPGPREMDLIQTHCI